jgi:hypothetical protein
MNELINTILPWLQYPAAALTIAGYYCVGSTHAKIRKVGFINGLVGNVIWIIYGIFPVQVGIVATNVCIFLLGVRGYLNNSYGINAKLLNYMREIGLLENKEKEN